MVPVPPSVNIHTYDHVCTNKYLRLTRAKPVFVPSSKTLREYTEYFKKFISIKGETLNAGAFNSDKAHIRILKIIILKRLRN